MGSGAKRKPRRARAPSFIGPIVHWTSHGRSLAHPRAKAGASNQVQLFRQSRVMTHLQRRMAVVGNGITDVGNQTPSRTPSQPTAERLAGSDGSSDPRIDSPLKNATISILVALSPQGGDSGRGNDAAPLKLVHLVARG